MKARALIMSAALLLAASTGSAFAGGSTQPKTMGNEGKLPATGTVSDKVPDMGATAPVEGGPSKRMGDEGKLPATKAMSGATPQQNAPATPPPAENK